MSKHGNGGNRVGVILIDNNKILLVEHTKGDKKYYVAPGGHVEKGEDARDAAIREVKEECNLDIEIVRKIAIGKFKKRDETNTFFFGKVIGGELTNDNDPDKEHGIITGLAWKDITRVKEEKLKPEEFFNWFLEEFEKIEGVKDLGEY